MKIGEKIGKVVKIDRHTEAMSGGQHIRLCVEVDISKPLLSKFRLNRRVWMIQYEGLRQICFKCGKLGHKEEQCPAFIREVSSSNGQAMEQIQEESTRHSTTKNQVTEERYGAWMLVQKQARQTTSRRQTNQTKNQGSNLEANQVNRQHHKHGEKIWKEKSQPQNQVITSTGSRFDILNQGNDLVNQGKEPDEEELLEQVKEPKESGNKENISTPN